MPKLSQNQETTPSASISLIMPTTAKHLLYRTQIVPYALPTRSTTTALCASISSTTQTMDLRELSTPTTQLQHE